MGYEILTHFDLSKKSADLAISDGILQALGLDPRAAGQVFPARGEAISNSDFLFARTEAPSAVGCNPTAVYTSIDLLACGAMFEDDSLRSLNHFMDPQHLVGGKPRPLNSFAATILGNWNSADWALADDPVFPPPDTVQQNSYKDARRYFYDALTTSYSETDRKGQWGLMFQSLGQVIHHIQDMAQPQHTRNDSHLDVWSGKDVPPITNVSRLEKRALSRSVAERLQEYAAAATPVYPTYATKFSTPRSFWINGGAGMAEYSSLNFVSEGTNFRMQNNVALANVDFPSPAPAGSQDFTIAQLANDPTFLPAANSQFVAEQCGADLSLCKIAMLKTVGQDPLTGATFSNDYASTFSVFDQDLAQYGATFTVVDPQTGQSTNSQRRFAINHYNIDAAYKFLIPKAVGYSAGLLNYFFRGQLSVQAPDAGVFAIVDHTPDDTTTSGCGTPCGFRTLKLKVKNTTSYDDMVAGPEGATLVAVAKYHLNNCYQPDLSGEYGAPTFAGGNCRAAEESITVSNAVSVSSVGRTFPTQPTEFTFPPAKPIPINATDLQLQVVYKGKLGEESGAVAVSTVDVSEPTFLIFGNHNDYQATYNRDGSFALTTPAGAAGRYSLNLELRFNPTQQNAIASSQLDPGYYHRVAILTDQPILNYSLVEQYVGAQPDVLRMALTTSNNQKDYLGRETNIPPYVQLRRTGASTWAYESDLRGGSIHWLPGTLCVDGTTNCVPEDKSIDQVVRRYPQFKQPTPKPMTISF